MGLCEHNHKIKITTNTNTKLIENLKMMVNTYGTNFCRDFQPFFERRGRMMPAKRIACFSTDKCRFSPYKTKRTENDEQSGTWEKTINLDMLPTKAENLKVKIKDRKLTISGVSEVENERHGFSLKSKHEWTREIQIPEFVEVEKIKVKMIQNNIVKITAVSKEDNDIDIIME